MNEEGDRRESWVNMECAVASEGPSLATCCVDGWVVGGWHEGVLDAWLPRHTVHACLLCPPLARFPAQTPH